MVISQKAKNIFTRLYIWCVADNFIVNYDLISPVGTMHRAPTLTFCLLFGLQLNYHNFFKKKEGFLYINVVYYNYN